MSLLDERIAAWRARLQTHLDPASADELEDHLRVIVDSLSTTGLSEEERLIVATHRLGQPGVLATEFEKNGRTLPWQTAILWLLIGALPLLFLQYSLRELAGQLGKLLLYSGCSYASATTLILAAHVASLGIVGGVYVWLKKFLHTNPEPLPQKLRAAFTPQVSLFVAVAVLICLTPFMVSSIAADSGWYNLRGVRVGSGELSDPFVDLLRRICSWLHFLNFLVIGLAITGLIQAQRSESEPHQVRA